MNPSSTSQSAPVTSSYTVTGMTCAHCVHAIQTEVGRIAGVTSVDVDLATGRIQVHADREPSREELASAIHEAGYDLA
jgi:copper chaperone